MGNRAVITNKTESKSYKDSEQIGVYLHWNGGRDSVEAFLKYCDLKGYRSPSNDSYGWARLTQVIANYFGGSTSLGLDQCKKLDCDNYDNGVYLIKGWEIIGREYHKGTEQKEYKLFEMLLDIDTKQPKGEQLGEDFIKASLNLKKDYSIVVDLCDVTAENKKSAESQARERIAQGDFKLEIIEIK